MISAQAPERALRPDRKREEAMKLSAMAAAAAFAMATTVGACGDARAAEIKVVCSNGFQAVMAVLGPQYERATGNKLVVTYGLAAVLGRQIEDGETFDLAILAPPQIDGLIKQNKIAADSRKVLARSGMGVMVRTGAPKPDVSTVDAFKRTLLEAKSVAFPPQGQSGIYLAGLIERLGLSAALKDKLKPIASGPLTGETVAKGEAEIGITPIGELLAVKGVSLVGPLPPEIQNYIVQTAGISPNAPQGAAARDFLKFLAAPENLPVIVEKGMEPG
jgi:molybdate transport system substrate-binding protein